MDTKDERKQESIPDKKIIPEQTMGTKTYAETPKLDQKEPVKGTGKLADGQKMPDGKITAEPVGKEEKKPSAPAKKKALFKRARKRPAGKANKPIASPKKSAGELLRESNHAVREARDLFEAIKDRNAQFLEEVLQVLSTAKVKRGYYEGNNGARPLPNDKAPAKPQAADGAQEIRVGCCLFSKRSKDILQSYADCAEDLLLQLTEYIAYQNRTDHTILTILYRLSELETGRLKQKETALQQKDREIAIYQTLLAETLEIQGQDKKKKNLIEQIEQFQIARNTLAVIRNICDVWGGSNDLQNGKYMLDKIKMALTDYEKELEENKNGGFGD